MSSSTPPDLWLFNDINALARHTGWLHAPMLGYASYGLAVFAALLVLGWWLARGRGPQAVAAALWAGAATLLAVGLNQLLVASFHEARPYTDLPGALVLAHRTGDFSFPSDHAVMAGAAAAGLWLVSRKLGAIATAAALVLAFSRIYIGAHYPHDVGAGLLFGASVALLGWWVARRPLTTLVRHLTTTRLHPLVGRPHLATSRHRMSAASARQLPRARSRRTCSSRADGGFAARMGTCAPRSGPLLLGASPC
ncbi:MAG: phosphatase PAP2 family protein [Cellulomonas sp.]